MFNEQTCSRFTHLFVCLFGRSSPCPQYITKPYNAIFLKSSGSKDIKTDIPNCQIHEYKSTNTQIQILTKCQKYPTYAIFLKSPVSKDMKTDIPNCQIHKYKYTNTALLKCQEYQTYAIFLNSC